MCNTCMHVFVYVEITEIYIDIHVFVCVCVCMYIYMYVCMHVQHAYPVVFRYLHRVYVLIYAYSACIHL